MSWLWRISLYSLHTPTGAHTNRKQKTVVKIAFISAQQIRQENGLMIIAIPNVDLSAKSQKVGEKGEKMSIQRSKNQSYL